MRALASGLFAVFLVSCAAGRGPSSQGGSGGSGGGSGGVSTSGWPDGGGGHNTGGTAAGGSGGSATGGSSTGGSSTGGSSSGGSAGSGTGGSSTGGSSSGGSSGSGGAPACPSGNGNYCGSAQNPAAPNLDTLYTCNNGSWTVKKKCSGSCIVDHCGSCPDGDGKYCGGDGVNGDANTLYECKGGTLTAIQVCPGSCTTNAPGTPDSCGSCPSGGNGAYCGDDGLGLDSNTLYNCQNGTVTVKQVCSNGCLIAPPGTADTCYSGSSGGGSCPGGNGLYCGSDGVNGDANTLYNCKNGTLTIEQHCANGCVTAASGSPDYCKNSCTATANSALQWEASQLSCCSSQWSDWCLKFVYDAYSNAGKNISLIAAASAKDALHQVQAAGKLTAGENAPCGAILFWEANSCNGGFGHVVISNGDGTVSTSGWPGYAGSTHATISWLDGQECGKKATGWFLP
jgi:hypothetical protein